METADHLHALLVAQKEEEFSELERHLDKDSVVKDRLQGKRNTGFKYDYSSRECLTQSRGCDYISCGVSRYRA